MASFYGIKNTLLAEQADKEAAPTHGPNLKSSKAPERYAPGRCGAYYLASAVTTMMRTLVCFPSRPVIVPSAVPM